MSQPLIPALLMVKDGDEIDTHYPVRLHAIPRPGEIIELTSLINIRDQQGSKFYLLEVIDVKHQVHDIDARVEFSKGAHDIIINVKNLNIV